MKEAIEALKFYAAMGKHAREVAIETVIDGDGGNKAMEALRVIDPITPEEGGPCPQHCGGTLGFEPVRGCSCHINPPCSRCTDNPLVCAECGWEDEGA